MMIFDPLDYNNGPKSSIGRPLFHVLLHTASNVRRHTCGTLKSYDPDSCVEAQLSNYIE
jgi:hypothetical protein